MKTKKVKQRKKTSNNYSVLLRKVRGYERKLIDGIRVLNEEGKLSMSVVLFVLMYPQLMNKYTSHIYKDFLLEIQNNSSSRDKYFRDEEIDETTLPYWETLPMLKAELDYAVQELITSGGTRKFYNTIKNIEKHLVEDLDI